MGFSIILAAVVLGSFPAQDAQDLINQLRSDKVEVRNEARRKLKEAGRSAVPALERAAQDPDPDVAGAAKELLRILPMREKLSPALRTSIPGIEERLALGGDPEWTRAFLEAVARDPNTRKKAHPDLGRADLELLVGPALRGADPGQAQNICMVLMNCPLRCAVPELAKLLRNPAASQLAVHVLSSLPFPETLEAVVALLKDPSTEGRLRAADALGSLHMSEAGPPLVALLADPDDQVKGTAIRSLGALGYKPAGPELLKCLRLEQHRLWAIDALGKVGCKEAAAEIAKSLDASNWLVRGHAAMALGELGAKEAAPRIAKLLIPNPNDQEKYGVSMAVEALGRLGAKDAIPLIRTYVADSNVSLRSHAITALAVLEDRESVAPIVPSLAQSDIGVCHGARHALRRLKATDQIPQIIALVKESPQAWDAISILADLKATDAVATIMPMLESPHPYEKAVAADTLCRLGSDQGVRVLLEHRDFHPTLMSLNALRRPDGWAKVSDAVLRENHDGRPVQMLESVAREAGIKMEFSSQFLKDVLPDQPLGNRYLTIPYYWSSCRPLDVFEWMAALTGGELILESDQWRWVSREEARTFWKAWLDGRPKSGK